MGEYMRWIIDLLKRNTQPLPSHVIADELTKAGHAISRSRVLAVINQINAFYEPLFHAPVITAVHRKGYALAKDYFTDGQLKFMVDALTFNGDLSVQEKSDLITLLLQLSSQSQKDRVVVSDMVCHQDASAIMRHLSIIMKDIALEKNVKFMYADYQVINHRPVEVISQKGNQGRFYVVSPYQILFTDNHYYLICHYDGHDEPLTSFRIDRMRHLQSASGPFVDLRDAYDLESYARSNFGMFLEGRRITLTIRFDDRIKREVISRFGKDMELSEISHHILEATISDVSYTLGLKNWLLMLGSLIQVVSPPSVKDDIHQELKTALKAYEA